MMAFLMAEAELARPDILIGVGSFTQASVKERIVWSVAAVVVLFSHVKLCFRKVRGSHGAAPKAA